MTAIYHTAIRLAHKLTELAEMCAEAGATASTVIYSSDRVMMFYKDPQNIRLSRSEAFDEL